MRLLIILALSARANPLWPKGSWLSGCVGSWGRAGADSDTFTSQYASRTTDTLGGMPEHTIWRFSLVLWEEAKLEKRLSVLTHLATHWSPLVHSPSPVRGQQLLYLCSGPTAGRLGAHRHSLSTKWFCWNGLTERRRQWYYWTQKNIIKHQNPFLRMEKEIWGHENVRAHTHTHAHTNCSNNLNKLFWQEKKNCQRAGHFFIFLRFAGNAKKVQMKNGTTVFPCAKPAAATLTGDCCLNNSNTIQRPISNPKMLYEEGKLISFILNKIPNFPGRAAKTDGEEENSFLGTKSSQ